MNEQTARASVGVAAASSPQPPARRSRGAHEFKLDAVMNAFVKIEPGRGRAGRARAALSVQVGQLPGRRRRDRRRRSRRRRSSARCAALQQRHHRCYENGRPLTRRQRRRPPVAAVRPLVRDRTSRRSAHVAEPIEPDTHIFIDQGYVDARINYPISVADSEFSRAHDRRARARRRASSSRCATCRPDGDEPRDGDHEPGRRRSRSTRPGCAPRAASSGSASRTS